MVNRDKLAGSVLRTIWSPWSDESLSASNRTHGVFCGRGILHKQGQVVTQHRSQRSRSTSGRGSISFITSRDLGQR